LTPRSLTVAALAAHLVFIGAIALGDAGGAAGEWVRTWFQPIVLAAAVLACAEAARRGRGAVRGAWGALAIGIAFYAAGWVVFNVEHTTGAPGFPTTADALWLCFYPAAAVALVLLARARHPAHDMRLWLDGLMGALAVATLGATFVYEPVFDRGLADTTAALAYPIGDLLLTGFVVGMAAVGGWRFDRAWTLLAVGFTLIAVSDGTYLIQAANGAWSPGDLLDVPYSRSPRRRGRLPGAALACASRA
jgi:diguanylate cyclase